MALTDFAFIVFGWDYDSEVHNRKIVSDTLTTRVIGVDSLEKAESVALELVADGVQLIELCGWFGPKGAARIIEAVGDKVPVGFVTHGPDSINTQFELFNS